jgi:hypothetical protein
MNQAVGLTQLRELGSASGGRSNPLEVTLEEICPAPVIMRIAARKPGDPVLFRENEINARKPRIACKLATMG